MRHGKTLISYSNNKSEKYMLGIPIGLITANAVEWAMHKYVLHGMGRDRGSFWSFHFHEHHKVVRQHDYYDPNYEKFPLGLHAQGKEAWSLIAASAVLVPVFPIAPFFVGTLWYSAANYYRVHKHSHQDPEWARQHVPWHYDHHMGSQASANWCVTKPWFDYLMGTRVFRPQGEREKHWLGLSWQGVELAPAKAPAS
ncbi:hypothetical protein [Paraperlucidibaca sp.]|jgi:sterol desaturase/sphingolipid hydroxylase (fatty acid hydroxylase superfamily)|uniref:hypothetical protein n=1 Tax=Paraperlucidibaca sp. TaxID=2708021 RepID=UPI003988D123|tara:strand:- start:13186 stop:13776 length:591 start_codon:yes stop_codon:yes gene_type:complete